MAPAAVDASYPSAIQDINRRINERVLRELERDPVRCAALEDVGTRYLLTHHSPASHRFYDESDMKLWANEFFKDFVPAALEFARTRAV